jgi:hypothetical protein
MWPGVGAGKRREQTKSGMRRSKRTKIRTNEPVEFLKKRFKNGRRACRRLYRRNTLCVEIVVGADAATTTTTTKNNNNDGDEKQQRERTSNRLEMFLKSTLV